MKYKNHPDIMLVYKERRTVINKSDNECLLFTVLVKSKQLKPGNFMFMKDNHNRSSFHETKRKE